MAQQVVKYDQTQGGVSWDFKRMADDLSKMSAYTGITASASVTRFSRQWLRNAMWSTPPCGKGALMKKTALQKRRGEGALEGDLRRLFPVFKPENISDPRLSNRLVDLAKTGDARSLILLEKIVGGFLQSTGEHQRFVLAPSRALHLLQRNKMGRVPKNPREKYMVLSEQKRIGYIADESKKVGYAKSGWKTAARKLKVSVPGWISRHSGPGYIKGITPGATSVSDKPSIEFSNDVPYVQQYGADLKVMYYAASFSLRMWEKDLEYKMKQIGLGHGDKMRARAEKEAFTYFEQ